MAALRERVGAPPVAGSVGDQEMTGRELPVPIRDLHTILVAGRDVAEAPDLAALLHTQATIEWLRTAGASVDLREQVRCWPVEPLRNAIPPPEVPSPGPGQCGPG